LEPWISIESQLVVFFISCTDGSASSILLELITTDEYSFGFAKFNAIVLSLHLLEPVITATVSPDLCIL
jgi:hypothetical protein